LGQPTYLATKVKGETSMSVTAERPEGIYGVVRLVPDDMVKARLPEPQFPAIHADPSITVPTKRRRLDTVLKGSAPEPSSGEQRETIPVGNEQGHLRRPTVYAFGNAGRPTGREPYGLGVSVVVVGSTVIAVHFRPHQGGRESRPQGEGRQCSTVHEAERGMRNAGRQHRLTHHS
jgi:hypothetical protein